MAGTMLRILALAGALALAACGGGGGGGGSSGAPSGASLILDWNANTEPDLSGYRIYQGTAPGTYQSLATVGAGVTTYTVTGLAAGATYYFAVTAYNSSGGESTFSNEVSKAF